MVGCYTFNMVLVKEPKNAHNLSNMFLLALINTTLLIKMIVEKYVLRLRIQISH